MKTVYLRRLWPCPGDLDTAGLTFSRVVLLMVGTKGFFPFKTFWFEYAQQYCEARLGDPQRHTGLFVSYSVCVCVCVSVRV